MVLKAFASALFTFILFAPCEGQSTSYGEGYQVDGSLKKETEKLTDLTSAVMDVTWLTDGKETPVVSAPSHPALSFCHWEKDTMTIVIMPWLMQGLGVQILILKDTVVISHFINPKHPSPSYKLLPDDPEYSGSIVVKSVSAKLVLTEPVTPGQCVQGYFEMESEVYFEKNNDGPDSKKIYRAKGYFNAKKM